MFVTVRSVIDLAALPADVRALIEAQAATIARQDAELVVHRDAIAAMRLQLERLRRMQFGRSSEKITAEIAQLTLALEDLEAGIDRKDEPGDAEPINTADASRDRPARRPLPDHLPRTTIAHETACACPQCGGALRRLCESITQPPAPEMPIRRGRASASLLAHVLVAKFADHLPLYRQSEIYERSGVDLERSTLADWVGQCAGLLRPLIDALGRHVMAGERVHADDTPVPVLAPGAGKTKLGRLWAYLRDERPYAGTAAPAVLYRYSPDRRAEHPRTHLAGFTGVLHADGYAGFDGLYHGGRVLEAACWAHVRRKFFDLHATGKAPLASEALTRIQALYVIESEIKGRLPDERRRARQTRAGPLLADMKTWLDATLLRVPRRGDLAVAIRYALVRWTALTRYRGDRQQPRRARDPANRAGAEELAVRGIGCRWHSRRSDRVADRDGTAQRPRTGSLPPPCPRADRDAPGQSRRGVAAVELRRTGRPKFRNAPSRLTQLRQPKITAGDAGRLRTGSSRCLTS